MSCINQFHGTGTFEKPIVFYHARKSHIIEPEGKEHFHRACYMTLPYSVFCVSVNYGLSCVIYNYIRLCVFVQPCYPQVCLHSTGLSSVVTNCHLCEKIGVLMSKLIHLKVRTSKTLLYKSDL